MKTAFVSYAEGLVILGNTCILKISSHYAKHSLSVTDCKSSGALTT